MAWDRSGIGRGAHSVDHLVGVRYWALGELRYIADAVIADANGDRVVEVDLYAGKTLLLSLAQRIGLASASVNQQAKWRVKIAKRDSTPALEGMESLGREKLTLLARVDRTRTHGGIAAGSACGSGVGRAGLPNGCRFDSDEQRRTDVKKEPAAYSQERCLHLFGAELVCERGGHIIYEIQRNSGQ